MEFFLSLATIGKLSFINQIPVLRVQGHIGSDSSIVISWLRLSESKVIILHACASFCVSHDECNFKNIDEISPSFISFQKFNMYLVCIVDNQHQVDWKKIIVGDFPDRSRREYLYGQFPKHLSIKIVQIRHQ